MARSDLVVTTVAVPPVALETTRELEAEHPTSASQKTSRVESWLPAVAAVAVDLPAVPAVQVDWLVVTALMARA